MTAALRATNVTVSYEARPVLRSVSFEAEQGMLIGIVGPNGAGKSTLLKTMLGLIEPDTGRVEVFGKPASEARGQVAYVPQREAVDWDFPVTVLDVVLMGRMGRLGWWGRPGAADRAIARQALEQVAMSEFHSRHIRQLSGGQQQRVFLARALAQEAPVLLLDEPLAGVDAATEAAIFDLMDALTDSGRTLVVVNHDLSVLDRFDAVLLLNRMVVAYGPPGRVVNEANLKRTYGGRLSLLEKADTALGQGGGGVPT
jgi:manganese/zinc/iron transport system ATP- binding protein